MLQDMWDSSNEGEDVGNRYELLFYMPGGVYVCIDDLES